MLFVHIFKDVIHLEPVKSRTIQFPDLFGEDQIVYTLPSVAKDEAEEFFNVSSINIAVVFSNDSEIVFASIGLLQRVSK